MWILLGIEHAKYDVHGAFLELWEQSQGGAVCSQGPRAGGVARPWKHPDTQEGGGKPSPAPASRTRLCYRGCDLAQAHWGSRGPAPKEMPCRGHTDRRGSAATEPCEGTGSMAAPLPYPGVAAPARCRSISVYFHQFIWTLYTLSTASLQKYSFGEAASEMLHNNSVATWCLQHAKGRQECSRAGDPVCGCQPPWTSQSLTEDLPRASRDRGL